MVNFIFSADLGREKAQLEGLKWQWLRIILNLTKSSLLQMFTSDCCIYLWKLSAVIGKYH